MRNVLARVEEIAQNGVIAAEVPSSTGGFGVVLTRVGEQVHAYHNECPHAGRRLDWAPGRFLIEHGHLVCAAHGAVFELDTGTCVGGPCRGAALKRVPVRVDGEEVVLG